MTEEMILSDLYVELKKGITVLSVLSCLGKSQYGYKLAAELSVIGLAIETNTLYPLLRRLERQGMLESHWDTNENKARKFYRRTPFGSNVLAALKAEWTSTVEAVTKLSEEVGSV